MIDDLGRLPQAAHQVEVTAPRSGYVQRLGAYAVGHATMLLGAGRHRIDSAIDPAVGVWLHRKQGDRVEAGEPLCTVLASRRDAGLDHAMAGLSEAYVIGDERVETRALIIDRV